MLALQALASPAILPGAQLNDATDPADKSFFGTTCQRVVSRSLVTLACLATVRTSLGRHGPRRAINLCL